MCVNEHETLFSFILTHNLNQGNGAFIFVLRFLDFIPFFMGCMCLFLSSNIDTCITAADI